MAVKVFHVHSTGGEFSNHGFTILVEKKRKILFFFSFSQKERSNLIFLHFPPTSPRKTGHYQFTDYLLLFFENMVLNFKMFYEVKTSQ